MKCYRHTIFGMKKDTNGKFVTRYEATTDKDTTTSKIYIELNNCKQANKNLEKVFIAIAKSLQTLSEEDKQEFVMTMHSLNPEKHSYYIERDTKI